MFCTHCEFEIKGDDRKECPVCGGPLIDYAEAKTSPEEIKSTLETGRSAEACNEANETLPFDFGKALEADDEHSLQEPEEYLPLSSLGEPELPSEAPGEERSAENAECTDVNISTGESDGWEEMRTAPKEKAPFDFGKTLEANDEHPVQEPEEYLPLSSLGEPEPPSEAAGEERSAENAECTDVNISTGESDGWEEMRTAPKEKTSFDFGKTLEANDEHPLQEPEEPPLLLSQSETEPAPEAADAPQSTDEVVPDIPDSYNTLPEEIIAAAQQTELNSTHASRKQLAISVMGVLSLVAAITTIAIFKPQQNFYPDIGNIKTKTERTVGKLLSIITQQEGKKVVAQKTSERSSLIQQRQREHAAGKVDPDKKRSRLEELSSGGNGKRVTVKEQLNTSHRKSSAKQAPSHAKIASLQETPPLLAKKDLQSLEMKRSTTKTLERETAPLMPVVKKTSHSNLYSIHTGSFQSKEVAVREINRLKKMGFQAYLQTVDLENGETWHRIKIGSYKSREEAEKKQSELRQKEPTLKSYIMRRATEPKKTATKREGKTSIATAGITPFVPGQEKRKLHHEKSDILEKVSPLQKTRKPGAEQSITGMKAASYLIPPEDAHSIGTIPENSAALPLLNENVAPELEQLITEMKGNPFTTLLVGEVIPPEDAGSIGTVPADTQQKEDHLSTGNTVPENMVHEEKEAVTPVE